MPDQYIFCCLALLEYAMLKGMMADVDLSRFEDEEQSDADDWNEIDDVSSNLFWQTSTNKRYTSSTNETIIILYLLQ